MRSSILYAVPATAVLFAITLRADDTEPPLSGMSVYDLMVNVMAPATDTLWGIEDPQSDEDWQVFIDAAERVIEAGNAIKAGGAGPDDEVWAANPAWQAFADRLIAAAIDARNAAGNQDIDAMWAAGDVLYPPCEECHLQFNPGVREDP